METRQIGKFSRLWRQTLARAAVAALCGYNTAPVLAQSPVSGTTAGTPQIETWYGLRRVDLRERPAEPPRPAADTFLAQSPTSESSAQAKSAVATTPPVAGKAEVPVMPIPVAPLQADALPVLPPAPGPLPSNMVPADLRETPALRSADQAAGPMAVPATQQPGPSGLQPAAATIPASPQPVEASIDSVARSKPAEQKPAPVAANATPRAAPETTARVEHIVALKSEPSASGELQRLAVLQFIGVMAAILLAPLVLALVFFRMVRRSASGAGAVFRVEVIGTQGTGVQPVFVTAPCPTAPVERPQTAPASTQPPFVPRDPAEIEQLANAFDPGPNYEEEVLARKQREQHQHGALLKHIFDENVRLREQLASAGAPAK